MDDITYNNLKRSTKLPFNYIKGNSFEPDFGDEDAYSYLEDLKANIADFVKKGKFLYLGSNGVGNGKTSWAVRLGSELFNKSIIDASLRLRNGEVIKPVFYVNVPDYLSLRKSSIGNYEMTAVLREYEHIISTARLVIFDDISDVKASEYDSNYLYTWVNTRIENGLSCIFTSNMETEEEMIKIYPKKLVDRILGYSKIVILKGGSARGER